MRQDLVQGKARSIDKPASLLSKGIAHSFSSSDPLLHKAGVSTNWGTAPHHIRIFLRSNNVNYGGISTGDGKIIPIFANGNGRPGNTSRQLQQQVWQPHPEMSGSPLQQLHSPQYWLTFSERD